MLISVLGRSFSKRQWQIVTLPGFRALTRREPTSCGSLSWFSQVTFLLPR
jgi:hypothetical protein